MNFRTQINIPSYPYRFGIQTKFLTAGSCFAEHIGHRLEAYKFKTQINPFGIVFHPIALLRLLSGESGLELPVFEHEGRFFHPYYHSVFSAATPAALDRLLNEQFVAAQRWIAESDVLLLTWGTAWGYYYKKQNWLVANCHKQPQKYFEKRLAQPQEIIEAFAHFYEHHYAPRPVVLTLSPVRHLKDTLPLNAVSKSVLRLAIHEICQRYEQVSYFPAYEWVLDDLRDYRFYESDMLHPNRLAIDYIWRHFTQGLLDAESQDFILEWKKIKQALAHKAFNPDSEAHQKFLNKLLQKLQAETRVDTQLEQKSIKAQIR